MGKVMKIDASVADAYVELTMASTHSEIWVTLEVAPTAASVAAWESNLEVSSFLTTFFTGYTAASDVSVNSTSPPSVWSGSDTGDAITSPTADSYTLVEFHWKQSDVVELYTDGTLAAAGTDGSGFARKIVRISLQEVPHVSTLYVDNVKVGTTRGGTDLFSDDFEDETFDAWTTTSGDVSIVDDPFAPAPIPAQVLGRPVWRWIVTDLRTSRVLTEITSIATDITTSRLLAAAWPASLTVPSDDPRVRTTYLQFDEHPEWDEPFVARSIRALIGFRDTGIDPLWECAYTGPIFQVADTVEDGVPRSRVNAWDCRKYLEFLPLVDGDGNLPGPDGITFTAMTANTIARAALENWIDNNPGCLAETLFDLSSGADETCAALTMTFDRGTTIADVWTQLEQTGAIDIVLDPVYDPRTRPGCLAVVNFEVEHGQARPAAIFSWDRSPRSLPQISRMEDGLKLANTIQDYTGDVEPADPATDADSVTRFGEYVAMRAWTGQADADAVSAFAIEELEFRKDGQTTVSASPSAPRSLQPIQEYDIGDRVPVYASERLRKPIASTMRIYGIPFTIDQNAVEAVAELIVSADAVAA